MTLLGLPAALVPRPGDETPLAMFDRTVTVLGDRPLFLGPMGALSASEVHDLVQRLAGGLAGFGVIAGDRVALHLQNDRSS